jgi:predicted nucleic-acid-binding protein
MIGIDTNVLVRYFEQDEPSQTTAAIRFIRSLSKAAPGYVSVVTLAELVWVLSRSYRESRDDIADTLQGILTAQELVVQNAASAYRALILYRRGAIDYADALISVDATLAGCTRIVTFDKRAASGAGMQLLKS